MDRIHIALLEADVPGAAAGGWSGGGSNTLNCMFRFPDVFSVGVSVAPVPDQRLHDTMHFHSLIARYFLDHLSPGARDVH